MGEFDETSTDTTGIGEIEASIEEMHYVTLYQKSLLARWFSDIGLIILALVSLLDKVTQI